MSNLKTAALLRAFACSAAAIGTLHVAHAAPATPAQGRSPEHARVVEHWTPARIAAAIPRDLVLDERGYGYLRKPNGVLEPYGHTVAAMAGNVQTPMAKPGAGDTSGPTVTGRDPVVGATISAAYTFKATVTDPSGVRSVSFRVGPSGGTQQSFNAVPTSNGVYTVQLSGFTSGAWTWQVVAKDKANNTTTTPTTSFTVSTGGGGGGTGTVIDNAQWTGGGNVQNAAGRIYFEMPSNSRLTRWAGYVCSGTVVTDGTDGRSVIQTAAHCVYDDAYKAFARNVLFIPNQDATTGAGTDTNCSNDPLGCWTTSFGVVDNNWTTRTFPDNIPWDYAYYVVSDTGRHSGMGDHSALDGAVVPITISFAQPAFDVANGTSDYTHALGYSYSDDPDFMYCAEDMEQLDADNWWLATCGLSGGSSGGPWLQPVNGGNGPLISVNSWGYTNQPGMAGPKLWNTSAACVFAKAKSGTVPDSAPEGAEGLPANCP